MEAKVYFLNFAILRPIKFIFRRSACEKEAIYLVDMEILLSWQQVHPLKQLVLGKLLSWNNINQSVIKVIALETFLPM